jgi:hypothetical protein
LIGSHGKHCIPNFRCGFVFDAKLAEFELTLSDPMHEFDAGDRRCGLAKILEAEHRSEPKLGVTTRLAPRRTLSWTKRER